MTTNYMNFIKPQEFIQQILEKFAQAYIDYVIMVKDSLSHIYPSQIAQI